MIFDDPQARDKEPGCTCGMSGLELSFMAGEPSSPDESWSVVDAECQVVCTTPRRDFAELVAWALNGMDNGRSEVCRIHTAEWWKKRMVEFAVPDGTKR